MSSYEDLAEIKVDYWRTIEVRWTTVEAEDLEEGVEAEAADVAAAATAERTSLTSWKQQERVQPWNAVFILTWSLETNRKNM